MSLLRRLRERSERGAVIAEAAVILPILFTLFFGLFDLGQWEFQSSQATAAARDGARAGLMQYSDAAGTTSSPGGAAFTTINNAVSARLAGQSYTLSVTCVGPLDETAISCATAEPDNDRIRVSVSWARSGLTPVTAIFGVQTVSGTAIMELVGAPS